MFSGRLTAQERVVTGTVTEANGTPISSASISIKGSNRGIASGPDGRFSIAVTANAKTLLISGINYQTLEVDISGKTSLGNIMLQAGTSNNLNEVVVVAYGTARKSNLTGSVATVSGAQLADRPFTSVDKALQGSVAGLQAMSTSGAPGSSTDIRIRGIGSISASASPLWVIDGVIANTTDVSVNTTTANPLSSLNPDDIESVTVLKDAASTAIYGSLAANGVILVTTKKGKAGKTRLNVVSEIGKNSDAYHPSNKPVNSQQAQTLMRQAVINGGLATDNAGADAFITSPGGYGLPADYATTSTDWRHVVTRKGSQAQLNVNVSGGNEKTQFYASAGYFKQDGTTIATDFKRYNGNLSVTHKATDRINLAASISGSSAVQHTPTNGGLFSNPVGSVFFLPSWYTPYNADGSFRYNDPEGEFPLGGGSGWNPVITAAWDKTTLTQANFRGNVSGDIRILDNLKFTSRYAAEYYDVSEDQYQNPFYGDAYGNGGTAISDYSRVFDYTWSNFLDFRQSLNKDNDLNLNLKVGYEAKEFKLYTLQAAGNVFPQTLKLQWLASAASPTTAYAAPTSNSANSGFAIADINYKDRYVLSGSFRRDGSSVFGANKRYGNFYSVGGSWNANEESFLKDVDFISLLKLRVSYGETGNALGIGSYTALPVYSYGTSNTFSYNYTGQAGSALSNGGNPDLTWEVNKIFNVGLDAGLFKGRLTATVEYYKRTTSRLLLSVPFSYTSGLINPASGGPTQNVNVGSVENKGFELTLGGQPVVTRDFNWTVSFNIAHNTNRVTALYQDKPIASGRFNYTVGHDLQTYYLRQWAGADAATGVPLWYTADGKTTTKTYSAAPQVLNHSAAPKVFGSFTNTFNYKGISLNAQFYYNFGNYIYDTWGTYTNSEGLYNTNTGQMTKELRAWQKPGDMTDVPQIIDGGNANSYRASTRFLYKGDYIRLRNIQLGFTLPTALVQKAHLGSVTIYARGTNLLTFGVTKDLPYDPETGINSNGNLDVFIPKTITGGIKIGL
jgi:TonB-linked SusC/RagA family outer membrane protein